MIIEPRRVSDAALIALVAEQQVELSERYNGEDGGPYPIDPSAHFLVAFVDGEPVACGAIQPMTDGSGPAREADRAGSVAPVAEVKRMYVRPAWRGRGVGRRLLAALESLAADRGRLVVRLETGTRQPDAIALYRAAGYRPIPAYGDYVDNPFSVCFEKALAVPAAGVSAAEGG
jgi:putative acetyltransferase